MPREEELDGFHLDSLVLEEEMKKHNGGIDLATLEPLHQLGDENFQRQYLPHFKEDFKTLRNKEKVLKTVNKFRQIKTPCSMSIRSIDSLLEQMTIAYQIAHFHYILGEKYNLVNPCAKNKDKKPFPNYCCLISSNSHMLSSVELGYPNAAIAASETYDHGYVFLPFVMKNNNVKGTIIIDPTSDQLGDKYERNSVFLKLGSKWEYKTSWENGANLFPDRICSIDMLRKTPQDIFGKNKGDYINIDLDYFHKSVEWYFKEAFSNPIDLENL